ncbi:hypothetical protein BIFGAL_03469 [Bifidobacterium gallicum DSM 20093 = LMG 11596]|uniref:Uncharacterized protein n=1 Tax=Bifidobacterium gallicum DSM 20093 = LMG 11596 TaxID=561180 RepID=D1NUE6_9BIFI|nr:hypothetical protein BIFGAL_03469 [Bifidobacterium gallicum DSM 20093 = LMG 11596]
MHVSAVCKPAKFILCILISADSWWGIAGQHAWWNRLEDMR